MDIQRLKECLQGRRELGIPIILPSFANEIFAITQWALEGTPLEARQIWFIVGNAEELRKDIPSILRHRILVLHPSCLDALFQRGSYDALLLPKHGFYYSDPNLILSEFWRARGSYQKQENFLSDELQLWFWMPSRKPLKLFAMDHHHAVLWDIRQILRPLGIQVDFHWISDGRPPVNEAIPVEIPGFRSSLDIYKAPVDQKLSESLKQYIKEKNYEGILTSHSMVTTYRLRECGLPLYHLNSTRFGNEWIQDPLKHTILVQSLQDLFREHKLHVIHNNLGDQNYLHQYIPRIKPGQEIVIPSLCENLLRLRLHTPPKPKILIWDTRQVLLQEHTSPFMKEFFIKVKESFGDQMESQAILMAQAKNFLPEGYLDNYTAIVHLPYNISTMSMFEQVRANIPIWVPSKRLLKELWSNPSEPNELSWCAFAPGSELNASTMDKCRDPIVIERWLECADFYKKDILPLVLEFDSIQEFIERAFVTDYQSLIENAEKMQQQRRENIYFSWEQVFKVEA